MADLTITGTTVTRTCLCTAAEVVEEGQLCPDYFPNCTNEAAMLAFIGSRIDDVDADVQLRAGAYYTSSDSRVIAQLHKCEIYLTLGRLWQIIKNVMDSYDAEALPPEFVAPDQAAANRDFYLSEGYDILGRFDGDTAKPKGQFVGAFQSGGVDEDQNSILGLSY